MPGFLHLAGAILIYKKANKKNTKHAKTEKQKILEKIQAIIQTVYPEDNERDPQKIQYATILFGAPLIRQEMVDALGEPQISKTPSRCSWKKIKPAIIPSGLILLTIIVQSARLTNELTQGNAENICHDGIRFGASIINGIETFSILGILTDLHEFCIGKPKNNDLTKLKNMLQVAKKGQIRLLCQQAQNWFAELEAMRATVEKSNEKIETLTAKAKKSNNTISEKDQTIITLKEEIMQLINETKRLSDESDQQNTIIEQKMKNIDVLVKQSNNLTYGNNEKEKQIIALTKKTGNQSLQIKNLKEERDTLKEKTNKLHYFLGKYKGITIPKRSIGFFTMKNNSKNKTPTQRRNSF